MQRRCAIRLDLLYAEIAAFQDGFGCCGQLLICTRSAFCVLKDGIGLGDSTLIEEFLQLENGEASRGVKLFECAAAQFLEAGDDTRY